MVGYGNSSGGGANAYKKLSIQTASPTQILIMLYEAAVNNLKKAADCIEKKDIAGKGKFIVKTHDILNELNVTLNHEVGGDVSRNLERLYNYSIERLIFANINNDKAVLLEIQKILENLLEGWRAAVAQVQRESSGSLQK